MVDTDWRIENHNIVRFTLHDLPALHDGLVSVHGAVWAGILHGQAKVSGGKSSRHDCPLSLELEGKPSMRGHFPRDCVGQGRV